MIDLPHGGALDAVRRLFPEGPEPWLDLSTGINPFAYPDLSISPEHLRVLPTEARFAECRAAMARAWAATPSAVAPTPGSELVIRHLPLWIAGLRVGVAGFSYADHEAAWRAAGREVVLADDPAELAGEVDVLIVVNPNNPDGRLRPRTDMEALLARMRARGGTLIVDEAFIDLHPEHSLCAATGVPGLVVLRSAGKFFGVAGLRLGALLGEPDLLARWRDFSGHWSVSGPALEIGARIYRDAAWAAAMRRRLAAWSGEVRAALAAAGVGLAGGTDLYALARVDDAGRAWERLARRGIYARRFAADNRVLRIGLPADAAALERLTEALRRRP